MGWQQRQNILGYHFQCPFLIPGVHIAKRMTIMETILNSKELSLVDASNDQQATCSEMGGLRTLDDLNAGLSWK